MKVVVVLAHPVESSFNHAIFERAVETLRGHGHEVTALDLYAEGFDPVMSTEERRAYHGDTPILSPLVAGHAAAVQAAEALVFVYPTWWSSMPAMLKGWLEKVMAPGIAFYFDDKHRVRRGLTHMKKVVGISTYASSWWWVKAVNDNGRRTLMRALRLNTGARTDCSWLGLYRLPHTTAPDRERFLYEVERRMAAL